MSCTSCGKDKTATAMNTMIDGQNKYPFKANDIQVVENGEIRRFDSNDWDNDKHKLIIFVPKAFTPVCATELGAMNKWYDEFQMLGCDLIASCTDPATMLLDWLNTEDALKDPKYKFFSSYVLPQRLSLIKDGLNMRASVFITNEGDVIIQQHFMTVGRSFKELHRQLYGYTTGSLCAEGWTDPSEGFLTMSGA